MRSDAQRPPGDPEPLQDVAEAVQGVPGIAGRVAHVRNVVTGDLLTMRQRRDPLRRIEPDESLASALGPALIRR